MRYGLTLTMTRQRTRSSEEGLRRSKDWTHVRCRFRSPFRGHSSKQKSTWQNLPRRQRPHPAAPTAPSGPKVSRTDENKVGLLGSLIGDGYEDLAVQIMVRSILQESDPCGRVAEICSTYSGTSALCSSGRVYELLNQFLGLYGNYNGIDKVPLESVPEEMRGGLTARTWFSFCCAIFKRLKVEQKSWRYEIPKITVELNGESIVLGPTSVYFWIVEAVERGFKSKTLAVSLIEIVDDILMKTFNDMDIAVRNVDIGEGMWAVEEYDDFNERMGVHRYRHAPYMLGAYDSDDLFESCMTSDPTVREALEKWQNVKVNLDETSLPRAHELLSAFLTIGGHQTTQGRFAKPIKFATDMLKGALELASLLQTSSTKELETVHRVKFLRHSHPSPALQSQARTRQCAGYWTMKIPSILTAILAF